MPWIALWDGDETLGGDLCRVVGTFSLYSSVLLLSFTSIFFRENFVIHALVVLSLREIISGFPFLRLDPYVVPSQRCH